MPPSMATPYDCATSQCGDAFGSSPPSSPSSSASDSSPKSVRTAFIGLGIVLGVFFLLFAIWAIHRYRNRGALLPCCASGSRMKESDLQNAIVLPRTRRRGREEAAGAVVVTLPNIPYRSEQEDEDEANARFHEAKLWPETQPSLPINVQVEQQVHIDRPSITVPPAVAHPPGVVP